MTGNRFINTGSGNYNENIQGNYIEGNYYDAAKPPSLIKSELSQEIANVKNEINKLELSTEQMKSSLLSYLPLDKQLEFIWGNKKIEEDIDWFVVTIGLAPSRETKRIRDKYKENKFQIESQRQHLLCLENEMKRFGAEQIVSALASIAKNFLS